MVVLRESINHRAQKETLKYTLNKENITRWQKESLQQVMLGDPKWQLG
jgi:hypothetical protein